ncbi:MAG: hypothetical protein CSA32_00860 [Desulfobulbus propionicus]|nr:MAG: hypothetical protein CSA32_00860 [Desulfobulbus propionicus]
MKYLWIKAAYLVQEGLSMKKPHKYQGAENEQGVGRCVRIQLVFGAGTARKEHGAHDSICTASQAKIIDAMSYSCFNYNFCV